VRLTTCRGPVNVDVRCWPRGQWALRNLLIYTVSSPLKPVLQRSRHASVRALSTICHWSLYSRDLAFAGWPQIWLQCQNTHLSHRELRRRFKPAVNSSTFKFTNRYRKAINETNKNELIHNNTSSSFYMLLHTLFTLAPYFSRNNSIAVFHRIFQKSKSELSSTTFQSSWKLRCPLRLWATCTTRVQGYGGNVRKS